MCQITILLLYNILPGKSLEVQYHCSDSSPIGCLNGVAMMPGVETSTIAVCLSVRLSPIYQLTCHCWPYLSMELISTLFLFPFLFQPTLKLIKCTEEFSFHYIKADINVFFVVAGGCAVPSNCWTNQEERPLRQFRPVFFSWGSAFFPESWNMLMFH